MGYDGKYYGRALSTEEKKQDIRDRFVSTIEVLKDTMKGSVYYAVVRNTETTFCVVAPTRMDEGYFMVKLMDESWGPGYYDIPKSYIALCTEPMNDYAKEWREKCLAKASEKTVPMNERKFQHGTQVLTLEEVKHAEGIWGDYLLRSKIVRSQKVGGGFVLNDHCYTRVY